jgi:hypothetical protein
MVTVGADQIGQHPRIPTIRLGPGDGVAFPIPAGRQRINRHHLIASHHQCPDQQPPVGLDPDHHLGRVAGMAGDELVQPSRTHHPIDDPLAGQHLAVGGHHTHVMVTLGPIDPDQQHRQLPSPLDACTRPEEGLRQPNGAVLNLGTSSHQPSASSPSRRGHGLDERAQAAPTRSVWCSPASWPHSKPPRSQAHCMAISSFLLAALRRATWTPDSDPSSLANNEEQVAPIPPGPFIDQGSQHR